MPLILRVDADTKKATSKIKSASKSAGQSVKRLEAQSVKSSANIATSFKNLAGTIGIAFGGALILKGIKGTIDAASDLRESINAVNVVFGEGADNILSFGKTAATSVGLANSEFNQMATLTGALFQDVGLSMDEVADLTKKLTLRAADLASVFNTDVKDAFNAINAAVRGETEAIRRYAADVTDASLQTFLLSKGIDKQVTTMSQQEKRLLRVEVLLSQTAKVTGDFAETSDELANATRIVGARIKNLAADLGDSLIPAAGNAVSIMGNLVSVFENYSTLVEKLDKFGGGPLSSEAIAKFKLAQEGFKGISEATKEFLELMDSIPPDAPDVPFVNVPVEEMELMIPPMNEVIAGLGEAETVTEKWLKLQEALAITIPEIPKNIKIVNKEMEAASRAAETFSQNLARALISGKGLEKSLLNAAISFGLSFIPGGSLFGGLFAHGGTAPGGFVPSIVGEGGGAPEIVQSASPIKVTPLTTNNNNSVTNLNLSFPNVREIDDFTLRTQIVPKINEMVQNGSIRLTASDLA